MKAYIPIPSNTIPEIDVIKSLEIQNCTVIPVECGELRDKNDLERYIDIGKGRIEAMQNAIESGEEFFVINNAGALHVNDGGILRCVEFLKSNPTWGAVALPLKKAWKTEQYHVRQECVVYRTEAVIGLGDKINWTIGTCECVKIRRAMLSGKKWRFGYLEREVNHLADVGRGFSEKEVENEEA